MAKVKQIEINEKYLWIGGGILTLIVLIFVAGRSSNSKSNQDPSDANPNISPITISTPSGSIDWNPSALVKEINTAYQTSYLPFAFVTGRCEVLNKLLDLQDVQLRAAAEGYLRVYGKTLRKTLNDAWFACNNTHFEDDPHQQVIRRMDTLQIP